MPQNPIVLVPGLLGTRLETKNEATQSKYEFWCYPAFDNTSEPTTEVPTLEVEAFKAFVGWEYHNPSVFSQEKSTLKPLAQWWLDQMRLENDGITPKKSPSDNKYVKGLFGIYNLNRLLPGFQYFQPLTDRLVEEGYQIVIGAGYD